MNNETRINKLKKYLVDTLEELNQDFNLMNYNFLSSNVDDYSLDKIPTKTKIEETITGIILNKDEFNFRGRFVYGSNEAINLENIGFWERFEDKIYSNNEQGILPSIDGIRSIECLNCGSLQNASTQDCVMSIQLQITYERKNA